MEKDKIREFFLNEGKTLNFKKGEVVLKPDKDPDGIYLIEKGFVKVYSLSEDGGEQLHIIYKKSESFPLIWMMHGLVRNAFYETLDETILKKVSKDIFTEFLKKDNQALFQLTAKLATVFNVMADRIDNLEVSKSYPRLILRLLFLAERFGEKKDNKVVLTVPLTHKDIASSINMSRETASREFEKLEREDLVGYKGHLIVIKNLKKLSQELAFHYQRQLL